ncbi:F-box domain [Dillenia turbinata]|uniref:F-box domain n=1 Tax=Dillenia turbinata TaxID=194707 RepID=A0AAN8VII9_9MAGN
MVGGGDRLRLSYLGSMPDIPIDIIPNILSRLPVLSLLRFKSVCKSWYNLISNPNFIKSHLQQNSTDFRILILFSSYHRIPPCPPLISIFFKPSISLSHNCQGVVEHHFPLRSFDQKLNILASCDGLLWIYLGPRQLFVWNPFVQNYRSVPEPGEFEAPDSGDIAVYGMGYDSSTDDYKLVVVLLGEDVGSTIIEVFSLKSNSWKCRVINFRHRILLDSEGPGIYLGGSLHWLEWHTEKDTSVIVSLNMVDEKLGEIPLPNQLDGRFCLKNLGVLNGCLSLFAVHNLWVMKHYGVKSSWTKLVTIPDRICGHKVSPSVPLCFSKDGEGIVLKDEEGQLVMYNWKEDVAENAFMAEDGVQMAAIVFAESLVLPSNYGSGCESFTGARAKSNRLH